MRRSNLLEMDTLNLINFAEKLEQFSSHVHNFSEGSEGKFLDIGNKLQKYLSVSSGLTKKSSNIAASISEEILNKGIKQLDWLLKEFTTYLEKSIARIHIDKSELQQLRPDIDGIVAELDGFSKIVKQLRMLGIATKIESARLGTEDQGFNALAENVDKLSTLISEKVDNIYKRSNLLNSVLGGTIENFEKLESEQKEQSDVIIKNISLSIDAFRSKNDERIKKSDSISRSSENITRSINEIVTSLQFHDITRQQMDHVRTALEESSDNFRRVNLQDDLTDSSELGMIHDVCKLQSIQLRNSLDEFVSAISQIVENLSLVEEGVTQILESATEMINQRESADKCCLTSVLNEIESIRSGLVRTEEIGNNLSKSIKSVVSVVDDLSEYVLEIDDIGSEIEIIALNARVKAARTGSNGSALGVLSERIQKLSLDAKEQTVATSKILGKVSVESKNLRVNVEAGSFENENLKLIEETGKISSLVKTMIESERKSADSIDKLQGEVHSFKNEIDNAVDSIHVHDDAKNAIQPVINGIDEIIEDLNRSNIVSNKNSNTKKLLGKYTMHSERKIHLSYVEEAGTANNKSSFYGNTNKESFGDNVELF